MLEQVLDKVGVRNIGFEVSREGWELDFGVGEGTEEMWVCFVVQNHKPALRRTHTPSVNEVVEHIVDFISLFVCEA